MVEPRKGGLTVQRIIATVKRQGEDIERDLELPAMLTAGQLAELIAQALDWDQHSSGLVLRYRIEADPPGRILQDHEIPLHVGVYEGARLLLQCVNDPDAPPCPEPKPPPVQPKVEPIPEPPPPPPAKGGLNPLLIGAGLLSLFGGIGYVLSQQQSSANGQVQHNDTFMVLGIALVLFLLIFYFARSKQKSQPHHIQASAKPVIQPEATPEPLPLAQVDEAETALLNETGPVLEAMADGATYAITGSRFILGRHTDKCHLVIPNKKVGRVHAQIVTKGEQYYLVDLDSKNGTFLNQVRLIPQREYPINNGDQLRLVDVEYIFKM